MLSSRGGSKGLSTLESMITGLIAGKAPSLFLSGRLRYWDRFRYLNH